MAKYTVFSHSIFPRRRKSQFKILKQKIKTIYHSFGSPKWWTKKQDEWNTDKSLVPYYGAQVILVILNKEHNPTWTQLLMRLAKGKFIKNINFSIQSHHTWADLTFRVHKTSLLNKYIYIYFFCLLTTSPSFQHLILPYTSQRRNT